MALCQGKNGTVRRVNVIAIRYTVGKEEYPVDGFFLGFRYV